MSQQIITDAEMRMRKCIETAHYEFNKLRTGRAHPGLVEDIKVVLYGTESPLKQMAAINVTDARTLTISPWDKNAVGAIEKAIMISGLGLNPATSGQTIRIPLPPLTEERRRDLIKVVHKEAESARVAIRNARRDANQQVKDLLKDKKLAEDEARKYEDNIQKLTDKNIAEIDKMSAAKEKELKEI